MNKISHILIVLFFLLNKANAQFNNCNLLRRNQIDISTVVNNNTAWRIINNPPAYRLNPSLPLDNIVNSTPFIVNIYGQNKLSITNTGQTNNRNLSNGSGNFRDLVPYIFERQFCVSNDNTNVSFNLDFTADDFVALSLVNLSTNAIIPAFSSSYDLSSPNPTNYITSITLNTGTYAIRASVINYGGPGISFFLKGSVNTAGNRLLETGIGNNCCPRINSLVISKVIDNNSNGLIDANDIVKGNWKFNISPNTNPVQNSAMSDVFGNAIFNNVMLSTNYTLSEVPQNGFQTIPPQNRIITNGVNQVNFINRSLPCDSSICCNGSNLIINPFFDNVSSLLFQSDYIQEINRNNLMPADFIIEDFSNANLICNNWIDTSNGCPNRCKVLFVNGRTNQPASTPLASVWRQNTVTQIDSSYQFCGKIRPLNNCCFNVTPKITIRVSDVTGNIINQTIILANPILDNCGWYNFNLQFIARNSITKVEILLDETVIGDGNDIAIDNIGLIKIPKISFLIGHSVAPTNPPIVTTSVAPNVTIAPNNCQFMWYVLEGELINNVYTPPPSGIPVFGRGNNNGSALNLFGSLNPLNPWTPINNTFSGFTFDRNRNYVIVFNAYNCNCAYTNLNAFEFDETTQLFRLANGKIEKVHKNILINQSIMNFIKDKQK